MINEHETPLSVEKFPEKAALGETAPERAEGAWGGDGRTNITR